MLPHASSLPLLQTLSTQHVLVSRSEGWKRFLGYEFRPTVSALQDLQLLHPIQFFACAVTLVLYPGSGWDDDQEVPQHYQASCSATVGSTSWVSLGLLE